jgi:hypothetical protein
MMDNINVLRQIITEQTIEIHQLKKRIELLTSTNWADGWVYESPDKGKTVYRRRPGSPVQSRVQIDVEDLPSYTFKDGELWTTSDTSVNYDSNGMDNDIDKPPF